MAKVRLRNKSGEPTTELDLDLRFKNTPTPSHHLTLVPTIDLSNASTSKPAAPSPPEHALTPRAIKFQSTSPATGSPQPALTPLITTFSSTSTLVPQNASPRLASRQPLSPRLRTLPRLDSYRLSSSQSFSAVGTSSARQVSCSSDESNPDTDAVLGTTQADEEEEEEDATEDEDDDGGGETEEDDQDQADRTITPFDPSPSTTTAPDDFMSAIRRPEWVTFNSGTPPTPHPSSRSLAQSQPRTSYFEHPLSRSVATPSAPASASYFELGPKSPLAASVPIHSPGARARAILLSPSCSSLVSSPFSQHDSRRPSLATSRRSQSVLDFQALVVPQPPTPAMPVVARSPTIATIASVTSSPVATTTSPVVVVPDTLLPIPRSPSLRVARRQSMYEMRPSTTHPPPYMQIYNTPAGFTQVILPREEEGREGLPKYSCVVHLEGWMPRKMEFKSPGVQAKDRAWKRQYVVVHGTMVRVYKNDPNLHPVPGDISFIENWSLSSSSTHHHSISMDKNHQSEGNEIPYPKPLHFHKGRYASAAPSTSLKEVTLSSLITSTTSSSNTLLRVYTLQNAESGLAADYLKRKNVVRVRAEGEQFLLQSKDDRGVIDLIETIQAGTNVALDLDLRVLPKFITLPRRRRRRRVVNNENQQVQQAQQQQQGGEGVGSRVIEQMIEEASSTGRRNGGGGSGSNGGGHHHASDRLADMLAEEQEAYMRTTN